MASAISNPQVLSAEEVLKLLGSRPGGLTQAEAEERLLINGPNLLAPVKQSSSWLILLRQFFNLLIIILLAASVISFLLGENLDAWLILAIILACVVLGFIQEYRAEQAAAALRRLAAPEATVVRHGKEVALPAREVVPGDVLALRQGDMVAADVPPVGGVSTCRWTNPCLPESPWGWTKTWLPWRRPRTPPWMSSAAWCSEAP